MDNVCYSLIENMNQGRYRRYRDLQSSEPPPQKHYTTTRKGYRKAALSQ